MNVIAEIGTAHGGSLEKAFQLIDAAVEAGADSIKFQWVYASEILHPNTGTVKLPGGSIPLYDRFKELEVSPDFFKECMEYTHKKGALFCCSPFGIKSLEELAALNPDFIKIASPEVNHTPLLKATGKYYGKIPVIISSGVSTLGDLEKALNTLTDGTIIQEKINGFPALSLLHCITSYPSPEEEYNVNCVKTLREIFGVETGISDHSLDPVLVPVLTVLRGGTTIEKHITLSRKTDGLDDPVALEPEQFAFMVHCVNQAEAVLNRYRKEYEAKINYDGEPLTSSFSLFMQSSEYKAAEQNVLSQLMEQFSGEKINKVLGTGIKKLAKSEEANYGRTNRSLHYMNSFEKGHILTQDDIKVLRTEKILTPGISPDYLELVTGSVLQQSVESGEGVRLEHLITRKLQ